jgi:epoxyqueuosine reductase
VKTGEDIGGWVSGEITAFANRSAENSLGDDGGDKAVGQPLVGFSRGDDPLYRVIKREIGDFYWTPADIFNLTFPESPLNPEQLSVVCWILPLTEATRRSNRQQKEYPSERWVRAKFYGKKFNRSLRQYIVDILTRAGYRTVAPVSSPRWQWLEHDIHGYASPWSERHVAFVSGLGTFGLCEGLITPVGKAVRIGSLVTTANLPPTDRPYTHHHEYCLYYKYGNCLKCVSRCPAAAISPAEHNKIACRKFNYRMAEQYKEKCNLEIPACGLCQTNVPCESGIPDAPWGTVP